MRRNSFFTFLKEKSFLIVLTLMLVSAGTMAVLFSFGSGDPVEENQVAKQEQVMESAPVSEEVKFTEAKKPAAETKKIDTKETEKETLSEKMQIQKTEAELEDQYLEAEEVAEASTGDVIAEGFLESAEISLSWPLQGEVILPFSMDHSVYFETLAQYQYNPAMIIGAEEGTKVTFCCDGTVIDVGKSSEYGYYVTVDAKDGYELTYGQLVDITVEVGEEIKTGETFASVCFPSRSYSAEGDNLYLKMTKDGEAVDPMHYLKK